MVAGGFARRFGGLKQFALLQGRPVAEHAVAAARSVAAGVVLVVPETYRGPATFGADVVVAGGPTRSASVRAGLAAVPSSATVVVVHDAARPLASPALFEAVVAALGPDTEGAICALVVSDTLKALHGELGAWPPPPVAATVERAGLVAVQTPQAFVAEVLRRAHRDEGEATDDAALVEALPATVRAVPGDPRNLKLTTPGDLAVAELLVGR